MLVSLKKIINENLFFLKLVRGDFIQENKDNKEHGNALAIIRKIRNIMTWQCVLFKRNKQEKFSNYFLYFTKFINLHDFKIDSFD